MEDVIGYHKFQISFSTILKIMCRLAAYSGAEIFLKDFLLAPEHSLYQQSWQPREMREATLNADGFGIGWYNDNLPMRYRNTLPVWNDANIESLASSLKRPLWFGYVRSATPGQGSGIDNTQPFIHNNFQFMHNGYIKDFKQHKAGLIAELSPDILTEIKGDTDSEYLFALLLQQLEVCDSIPSALELFCQNSNRFLAETSALINIIISDGVEIHAIKFSINAEAPTLYYTDKDEAFPDAAIIASEPFTTCSSWQAVPEQTILTIDSEHHVRIKYMNG